MEIKKNNFALINGCLKNEDEAFVSAKNSGFLFGDGLFETIKYIDGSPCFLHDHLLRIYNSLEFFQYRIEDFDNFKKKIIKNIDELAEINELKNKNSFIKIIVCRDEYKKRLDYKTASSYLNIIFMEELVHYPENFFKNGIDVVVSSIKRVPSSNVIYRHKVLNYFENIFARNEAVSKGADESLFISYDGFILEAAVSNIFIVKNEKVITPDLGFNILPGITREKIIKLCRENNIEAEEKEITLSDLYKADEVFLTNSLAEILPVKKIENHDYNVEKPGSITKKLSAFFKNIQCI